MSDKVQKIRQEIEKRIELLEPLECEYNKGSIDAYKGILQFIDSLPEEPKKQPKYKVGDIIKGPHNNIFEIMEVLENQYVLHSKNGDELNSITIVDRSSCVVEEPASEDLDFLVISLEETIGTSPHSREVIKKYLQKAAEWGRTHFEDKSEMVCEDLEEYYKKEFLPKEWFSKPGHRTISQFNFFTAQHFAEWQRKKDQETIELAEDHAMLAGMMKEREELMKDAVDGEYWDGSIYLDNRPTEYKDGDKVKIIIVKEN